MFRNLKLKFIYKNLKIYYTIIQYINLLILMQKLLVIDYWSQYTHLITSKLRRLWVYAEIIPAPSEFVLSDILSLKDEIEKWVLRWIVLSWGPNSVYDENSPIISSNTNIINDFFNLDIPILAICYGHQLVAQSLDGKVSPWDVKEYWLSTINTIWDSQIFTWVWSEFIAWMSHGDEVSVLPEWFTSVWSTDTCKNAALENKEKNIFTLQFHPEVKHTKGWNKILSNFINLCWFTDKWSLEQFLEEDLKDIKTRVWDKNVFLMISWWVDSVVAYFVLEKAIGADRIYSLFVDTWFMRRDEWVKVKAALENAWIKHFHVIDAKTRFMNALDWVLNPEEKRKIIGDLFIEIQKNEIWALGLDNNNWFLGQGTIYPDTIESGWTKHADKIKTHHNRVPEIEKMIEQGLVIEPISKLYKDEVRNIWNLLWVPKEIVDRHPFPGPGLAVRILCSDWEGKKNFDKEEGEISTLLSEDSFKASVLPVQSVWVQWDNRSFRHPALIFWDFSNWEDLWLLSTKLTNKFSSINRVLFLIESLNKGNNDSTYKLKKSSLTEDRVILLQEIDAITWEFLINENLLKEIWQFPVVLVPVSSTWNKESIVLRPIESEDAMTASFYPIEFEKLKLLSKQILRKYWDKIENIFYDITNKPPGTIEWE